MALQKD